MMIKKIHILVDGTTMYASLPFIANPVDCFSQTKVKDQLNNSIFNSNGTTNTCDNATHQDSTSSSSTVLKSQLRPRATKKRKTKCHGNISNKFDDYSDSSNNDDSNGIQDNRKRKKRSVYEFEAWNNKFLQLADYKRKFKHTNVPCLYAKNKPLGKWVSRQRGYYKLIEEGKPSPLTKERINSLNKLGFVWILVSIVTWEERLQQLVDFNDEFNHTNVPKRYTKNTPLGRWVEYQRYLYKLIEEEKPSTLTKGRIESLNKLGFVWRLDEGASTATSLLSSSNDDNNYDDYSNNTCTTGNNKLGVVSSTTTTPTTTTAITF
mmetsp:Transcript_13270/g.14561  ORF Transcript_13270/g.14561 Transcript_13270/m.14561 type:complete len:320 (+) Transcript_13270:1142-2101(+)